MTEKTIGKNTLPQKISDTQSNKKFKPIFYQQYATSWLKEKEYSDEDKRDDDDNYNVD